MMKDTPERALSIALLQLDKALAVAVISRLLAGEKLDPELVNKLAGLIERSPILDTMEQDDAIELLRKNERK